MRRLFIGLAIFAIAVPAPLAARADDRDIAQQIVKTLQAHRAKGDLKDFNLGLRVEEGAVYLSGDVATKEQERLAITAARRAEGVQQVYNQIKVTEAESAAAVHWIASESNHIEVPIPAGWKYEVHSRGKIPAGYEGAVVLKMSVEMPGVNSRVNLAAHVLNGTSLSALGQCGREHAANLRKHAFEELRMFAEPVPHLRIIEKAERLTGGADDYLVFLYRRARGRGLRRRWG